ncbi:MAG TPA: hypothetical protein VLR47_07610 [Rhodospirillales bacterium]|nr:hypothetical protein [Rhodospirillales bacterium]
MSKASGKTPSAASGGRSRTAGLRRPARKKRGRAAGDGLETAPDGTVIGQDPRRLSPDEFRALGHRAKPLLQAMRRRCIDCCGGKSDEVRRCTAVACPLWPYRMGTDPWHPEPARPVPNHQPATAAAAASPVLAPEPPALAAAAPAAAAEPPAARKGAVRRRAVAAEPFLPFLDDVPA